MMIERNIQDKEEEDVDNVQSRVLLEERPKKKTGALQRNVLAFRLAEENRGCSKRKFAKLLVSELRFYVLFMRNCALYIFF